MSTPADPFLMEKVLDYLSTVDHRQAIPARKIAAVVGVVEGTVLDPLKQLVQEGLVEATSNGQAYAATSLGRQRAAAALDAEMQDARDEDAAALVASMASMAPTPREVIAALYKDHGVEVRESLVASFNALAPSPALRGWLATANQAMADHAKNPTIHTALRVRRAARQAMHEYDPNVIVEHDLSPALVASAAPAARSLVDAYRAPCESPALVASTRAPLAVATWPHHSATASGDSHCCGENNCDDCASPPGVTGVQFR